MAAEISCMRGVPGLEASTARTVNAPYTIESKPQPMIAHTHLSMDGSPVLGHLPKRRKRRPITRPATLWVGPAESRRTMPKLRPPCNSQPGRRFGPASKVPASGEMVPAGAFQKKGPTIAACKQHALSLADAPDLGHRHPRRPCRGAEGWPLLRRNAGKHLIVLAPAEDALNQRRFAPGGLRASRRQGN